MRLDVDGGGLRRPARHLPSRERREAFGAWLSGAGEEDLKHRTDFTKGENHVDAVGFNGGGGMSEARQVPGLWAMVMPPAWRIALIPFAPSQPLPVRMIGAVGRIEGDRTREGAHDLDEQSLGGLADARGPEPSCLHHGSTAEDSYGGGIGRHDREHAGPVIREPAGDAGAPAGSEIEIRGEGDVDAGGAVLDGESLIERARGEIAGGNGDRSFDGDDRPQRQRAGGGDVDRARGPARRYNGKGGSEQTSTIERRGENGLRMKSPFGFVELRPSLPHPLVLSILPGEEERSPLRQRHALVEKPVQVAAIERDGGRREQSRNRKQAAELHGLSLLKPGV